MVGSHSPAACLHQHGRNICVHAGQTTAGALVQSRGTKKQSSCYAADLKAALRLPTNATYDRGGFLFQAGIHAHSHESRACYPRDFLLPTPGVTSTCTHNNHNNNRLRLPQQYYLIGTYSDLFHSPPTATILTLAGTIVIFEHPYLQHLSTRSYAYLLVHGISCIRPSRTNLRPTSRRTVGLRHVFLPGRCQCTETS